jgi:quercetin dioxygenase-like cupin family protein
MNLPKMITHDTLTPAEQTFDLFGVLLTFLVTPDQADGQVTLFKGTIPPGAVIPLHSHAEPEVLYVLEGTLELYRESNADQQWSTVAAAGGVAIPGNEKHALRNTSAIPMTTILVAQSEIYKFFREIAKPFRANRLPAQPSPEDMQHLFAAAAKYHYWMGSPEENAKIGIFLG